MSARKAFVILCLIMWAVNGYLSVKSEGGPQALSAEDLVITFVAGGFGRSVISIPVWTLIGYFLGSIGLFSFKRMGIVKEKIMTPYGFADVGLILGIALKPLLGIGW